MNRPLRLVILGWLVVLLLPQGAGADSRISAQELFFEANRAYKSDAFRKAADTYLKLIEEGFEDGHIYYNLGNAFFRLGELGRAILSYERARCLIPRDDDLNFNLSHARTRVQDIIGDAGAFPLDDFLGLDGLNLYEAFWVFALVNGLFFAVLCTRLFKRSEWTYYLSILLAIFVAIGAAAFALKWYGAASDDRAIVVSEEAAVRAGPDSSDTVLFKIHEGAVVHHERTEGDWVLLHVSQDKRGWMESRHLERVIGETRASTRRRGG